MEKILLDISRKEGTGNRQQGEIVVVPIQKNNVTNNKCDSAYFVADVPLTKKRIFDLKMVLKPFIMTPDSES
ncbi:MAG: hypothetical protein F6K18_08360 [Okeania sp. SIO2C2]|uniref:hypothetical protein n=1 Tax=Okeania sp. SIO2C2 TaxID=2607787 RepID=UPI0013BADFA0|nr:hypothetical protein [Okeania sp. SIO2C2]NEP86843.1 hypothetical protein [Okeania sp. SIO2C2]